MCARCAAAQFALTPKDMERIRLFVDTVLLHYLTKKEGEEDLHWDDAAVRDMIQVDGVDPAYAAFLMEEGNDDLLSAALFGAYAAFENVRAVLFSFEDAIARATAEDIIAVRTALAQS